jgi:hypothetical protein
MDHTAGLFNSFRQLFRGPSPQQKARVAFARLVSQWDMVSMPYDEGLRESRRSQFTRSAAIGVRLAPLNDNDPAGDVDWSNSIPAVTRDLRRSGLGLLLSYPLTHSRFLVAVADQENTWRCFLANARHLSPLPGGWYQLGLTIESLQEITPRQAAQLRQFAAIPTTATEPEAQPAGSW